MMIAVSNLFEVPEWSVFGENAVRLVVSAILGGLIGWERESKNRAAGLRTHILVAVAAAMFVLAPELAGMSQDAESRVIQGVVQGIGFLGAGTIIKLTDRAEVKGLTTAASIFATAAIGVATGCASLWLPILGTIIALITLRWLTFFEHHSKSGNPQDEVTHG